MITPIGKGDFTDFGEAISPILLKMITPILENDFTDFW
jgi:hypothetical protein